MHQAGFGAVGLLGRFRHRALLRPSSGRGPCARQQKTGL